MNSEPKSHESPWHFNMCPEASSSGSNPADYEPIPNIHNEHYPKYCIDEFEDLDDYMKAYVRYRIAGGRMKFEESDTGSEQHYTRFPGIELDKVGEWHEDRNNVVPCEWTMCDKEYIEWFLSTHPKPVDVRQATRYWLDRRELLWRRQHPAPGSYEEFVQNRAGLRRNYEDGCYDYVAVPQDTWDKGSLYRMHMIRQQAAIIDLQHNTEDRAYITEQQIDNYLIANHEDEEGEVERTLAAQQKYEATLKMAREANAKQAFYYEGARTRTWPKPTSAHPTDRKSTTGTSSTDPYRQRLIQGQPYWRMKTCSGATPVFKSELRTQRATTLSERIGKK